METEVRFFQICQSLQEIIERTGEQLEGNCVYKHRTLEVWDRLESKRANLRLAARQSASVCEVGFNAGHSALVMLLANPAATFDFFDLGQHAYARPCFEYIQGLFPDVKMEMHWGDSTETFTAYRREGAIQDLVHIDGSHRFSVFQSDWENAVAVTRKGGLLVCDDTDNSKISAFIDKAVSAKFVEDAPGFLPTSGYPHRVLLKA